MPLRRPARANRRPGATAKQRSRRRVIRVFREKRRASHVTLVPRPRDRTAEIDATGKELRRPLRHRRHDERTGSFETAGDHREAIVGLYSRTRRRVKKAGGLAA